MLTYVMLQKVSVQFEPVLKYELKSQAFGMK